MYSSDAQAAWILFRISLVCFPSGGCGYVGLRQMGSSSGLSVFEGIRLDDSVLTLKRKYSARWINDEFDVLVTINSGGFREDKDFELEQLDVAFFGDSFTFGQGAKANERYSSVFAQYFPDRKIASLAYASGFEPEHYEFYFNTHPTLAPKLVVVGLYLGNDLESDVRETWIHKSQDGRIDDVRLPYRKVFQGNLVNRKYRFPGMSFAARHSFFFRYVLSRLNASKFRDYLFAQDVVFPNMLNSPDTERGRFGELGLRSLDSLGRLNSIVKERGGRLIVLIIPQDYFVRTNGGYIRPELVAEIPALIGGSNIKTAVEAFCRVSALDCLDPVKVLTAEDYFAIDSHWTVTGHAKVGKLLAQHVGTTRVLGIWRTGVPGAP